MLATWQRAELADYAGWNNVYNRGHHCSSGDSNGSGTTITRESFFLSNRTQQNFEGHDRILNRYLKPDLLILDDMGMKQLPKKSGEFLFEIIMRRHELRSTMMTSNRPLEDWGKLIGDVPAATAILDRFLQDAELIQVTGRSYRLRGRQTDKESRFADPTESDSAEPANSSSKTGQTRKPARNTKATKNASK